MWRRHCCVNFDNFTYWSKLYWQTFNLYAKSDSIMEQYQIHLSTASPTGATPKIHGDSFSIEKYFSSQVFVVLFIPFKKHIPHLAANLVDIWWRTLLFQQVVIIQNVIKVEQILRNIISESKDVFLFVVLFP